jgi:hypothetical protein
MTPKRRQKRPPHQTQWGPLLEQLRKEREQRDRKGGRDGPDDEQAPNGNDHACNVS